MKFDLKSPCRNCPFRSDVPFYLHPDRVIEITDGLFKQNQTFACHKTVDYDDEGDGRHSTNSDKEQHCAGALIMMEKQRATNDNFMLRLAQSFGLYDVTQLKLDAPVYDTPKDMELGCGGI